MRNKVLEWTMRENFSALNTEVAHDERLRSLLRSRATDACIHEILVLI